MWAVVALMACETGEEFTTSEGGLRYQLVREGEGPKPQNDEILLLHFRYDDANGNIMYSTELIGGPVAVMFHDSLKTDDGNLEDVFQLLGKGDSVVVKIGAEKLFANTFSQPLPDTIAPESDISFFIGVEDVMSQDAYNTYRMEQYQIQQEQAELAKAEQLKTDVEIITDYLEENNIEAEKTESGLHYVVHKKGTGPMPEYNDVVDVAYKGYLLDGRVFDTSYEDVAKENNVFSEGREYAPYPLQLRKGGAIDGWVEAIGYLPEGSEATLYIPSTLAYGPSSMGGLIGPNTVLAFDVEIVKVSKSQE